MAELELSTQTVEQGFYNRVSKPRNDKDGNLIAGTGGRDLGSRLNLLGGSEANKFGTVAEFKAELKVQWPNLSNREIKEKVRHYFARKDVQGESQLQATVALQLLHQRGFQAQNLDVTKTGRSAVIRFHRPAQVNPAELLMKELLDTHGQEGTVKLLEQAAKAKS